MARSEMSLDADGWQAVPLSPALAAAFAPRQPECCGNGREGGRWSGGGGKTMDGVMAMPTKPLSRSCTGNLVLTSEEKETVWKLMDQPRHDILLQPRQRQLPLMRRPPTPTGAPRCGCSVAMATWRKRALAPRVLLGAARRGRLRRVVPAPRMALRDRRWDAGCAHVDAEHPSFVLRLRNTMQSTLVRFGEIWYAWRVFTVFGYAKATIA
uniref:Uncharacterized protein n=1 Tax=Oryza meridionalis TaxID=40149 RepID=A0A0E0E0A1_9ORYZ